MARNSTPGGDAGYQGLDKRQEMQRSKALWLVVMRPGKRKTLDPERELHRLLDKAERLKASVRGDQAAVWVRQGALPGIGEEHGASHDAVCAGQSMDGQKAHHGAAGVGAPAGFQSDIGEAKTGLQTAQDGCKQAGCSGIRRARVHYRAALV